MGRSIESSYDSRQAFRYDTGEGEGAVDRLYSVDRELARRWARGLIDRRDWAILDTETTGLDDSAEIVQIAIVEPGGSAVLDTLVRPRRPIPADATAIHGITNAMVADAPRFVDLVERLVQVIADRTVIAYNAAFDRRMVAQTARASEVRMPPWRWECAMERYAEYVGQRSSRRSGYVWQSLPRGSQYRGKKHQAIDDCLATLDVIRRMAQPVPA
jgi:DNA polymerase III epsilon subunit-like protein